MKARNKKNEAPEQDKDIFLKRDDTRALWDCEIGNPYFTCQKCGYKTESPTGMCEGCGRTMFFLGLGWG